MPPLTGFSNKGFSNTDASPRQAMSSQMNQQQKKKPWWTSLISEVGGAGGASGGAAAGAALGSVVPGLGTALGGLAGAAVGGFLGGTGGRVVENEVRDNRVGLGDALKEGVTNAVLSAGPSKLLKVAKGGSAALTGGAEAFAKATAGKAPEDLLKTSARGKLYNKSNQILASQYGTISKPVARANKPLDTISKLSNVGIIKPTDAERVAGGFTGSRGLVNQAVANAVEGAGKVPIAHIPQLVEKSSLANGLVSDDAKSVGAIVQAQLGRLGAEGTTEAGPTDTLKVMRSLEARQADLLGKSGNYHLPTSTDKAKAAVLGDVKSNLEEGLFKTADANGNVSKVLTPEFQRSITGLHPGNAQWKDFVDNKVMKAKSVGELRGFQQPFVRISKIIDEGDTNALTYGGRAGNAIGGGGSVGKGLLNAVNQATSGPRARIESKILKSTATAGLGPLESPGTKGIVSRFSAGSSSPGNLLHGGSSVPMAPSTTNPQDPNAMLTNSNDQTSSLLGQANGSSTDATSQLLGQPAQQQSQQSSGPSLQSLQQAIQQDIQSTGGKNINNLMQLAQTYGIVDSSGSPVSQTGNSGVGKPTAQQNGLAKSAAQSLAQMAQLIQADPSIIEKNNTPGQGIPLIGSLISGAAGDSNYHSLADNVLSSLIHLQTGATATPAEVTAAHGQLPQPGDPPAVQQRKLQTLLSNFAPFLGNN